MRRIECDICKCHDSFMPASKVVFDRIIICDNCTYFVMSWGRENGFSDIHPFFSEFRCTQSTPIRVKVTTEPGIRVESKKKFEEPLDILNDL